MPTLTFRRLAWATAIATYALVVLGGATKAYGAGLSCPDWPLCFGQLIPQFNFLVLLEWSHRLLASFVILLSIATTVSAYRIPEGRGPWVRGALLALSFLPIQAVLGGMTVLFKLHPAVDAAHLGVGTAFLSTWVVLAVSASLSERGRSVVASPLMWMAPLGAALSAYATMVVGSYMKASGAGLGCPDWPLCKGALWPSEPSWLTVLQFTHRLAALMALVLILYAAYVVARRAHRFPALAVPAGVASGLVVIQVLLGGVAVLQKLPPALAATHLAVAAALLSTLVALTTVCYRLGGSDALEPPIGRRGRVADYVQLMKPRILLLILVTGYGAMWVASHGMPDPLHSLITMLGLFLTSGGANAVNMWYDRDIDAIMTRTKNRPLPAGRLTPHQALTFGVGAGIVGVLLLAFTVNILAASLALAGYLYYVLIYTMWLKRTSHQNIVIGGGAGAIPPLVGWAAVTGSIGVPAMLMFLVVFLWTPPHFWALALFRNDDYRRAGVPMLPVVRGESQAKWGILVYALLVIPASLLLYWTGVVGSGYLWAALILGVWFASACYALLRGRVPAETGARRVFGYSIVYLMVLFIAMLVDVGP